jgi:CHAT domain
VTGQAAEDPAERDQGFAALAERYLRTAEPADFDAAVAVGARLLGACGGDAMRELRLLSTLNGVLSVYCDATRDLEVLARIVAHGRRMLELAAGAEPQAAAAGFGPYWLPGLRVLHARALLYWYQANGDRTVLDEAVGLCRAAVAAIPAADPAAARPRAALARALRLVHERTGDGGLLDEGIACLRQAPPTREIRAALAASLRDRYRLHGQVQDLDEAITVLRAAQGSDEAEEAGSAAPLALLLAVTLVLRHAQAGDMQDLDEAVQVLRAELARTPETGYERPNVLHSLAYALAARYGALGAQDDLAEALRLIRQALATLGGNDASRGGYLNSLGDLLRQWHQHTGEPEALEEAITVLRAARQLAPAGGADRLGYTVSLAAALATPQLPQLDGARLDEAIELLREALAESPAGHLAVPLIHNNLATALLRRAGRPGPARAALADCDEAAAALDAALAILGEEHADRAPMLANLALAQFLRHRGSGDRRDLAAALGSAERAAACNPPRARFLLPLAFIARESYRLAPDESVRHAALQALQAAVADQSAPLNLHASAFRLTGELLAADRPGDAAAAYARAVELLPRIAPRHLRRSASEQLLGSFAGLAADAAACALLAHQADQAVSLLELGRGVLLTQRLDARTDLAGLRAASAELADRFAELRDALDPDAEPDAPVPPAGQARAATLAADRRRLLAAQWDDLLARIRQMPGFAGFLRQPRPSELLAEAREGAIALVNASRHRCDALLLTSEGLKVVPLPSLTVADAEERSRGLLEAVERAGQPWLGARVQHQAEQEIVAALRWLWETTAGPVLRALGIGRPSPAAGTAPRIWWSAIGALGQMPLHAAGRYEGADDRQTVLDCAVSSYTPTVGALRHARRAPALRLTGAGRTLVVALARTPGEPDLPGAAAEAAAVAARFPGCRLLAGAAASRAAVIDGLGSAQIAHFACHGRSDPDDPSASGLLLHDHRDRALTIGDIARLDLQHAMLAYLSACETTRTAQNLTDEAVHITGAFQMAGFPEVVGTLWSVDDAAALAIATRVYGAAPGTGRPAPGMIPSALRQATLRLRASHPDNPSQWAGFIHVGR